MKKYFLALIAFANSVGFANFSEFDVRLKVETHPVQSEGMKRGVAVLSDGQVVYFETASDVEGFTKRVLVARLGTTELQNIDEKIEIAREGRQDKTNVICRALPTKAFDYTADNNQVGLLSGMAPCGELMVNQLDESKALVEILNRFLRARNGFGL